MLWGFFFLMPCPQAGETDAGLRTLALAGEPLQCSSFPGCRAPAQQLWDLIRSGNYPSSCSHCGCFLVCKISVLVGSSLFYWWLSAVSCDIGVFPRGPELSSFHSAVFSGIEGLSIVRVLVAPFLIRYWPLSPCSRVCDSGPLRAPGSAGLGPGTYSGVSWPRPAPTSEAQSGGRRNACSQSSCRRNAGVRGPGGESSLTVVLPPRHTPPSNSALARWAQASSRYTLGCHSLDFPGSSAQPAAFFSLGLPPEASSSAPSSPRTDRGMSWPGSQQAAVLCPPKPLFHPV